LPPLILSILLIAVTVSATVLNLIKPWILLADILVPFLLLYIYVKIKKINSEGRSLEDGLARIDAITADRAHDASDGLVREASESPALTQPPPRDYWLCRCGEKNGAIANYCPSCGEINRKTGQTARYITTAEENTAPERLADERLADEYRVTERPATERCEPDRYVGERPATERPPDESPAPERSVEAVAEPVPERHAPAPRLTEGFTIEQNKPGQYLSQRMIEFVPKPDRPVDKQYLDARALEFDSGCEQLSILEQPAIKRPAQKQYFSGQAALTAPKQPEAERLAAEWLADERALTERLEAEQTVTERLMAEIINKVESGSIAKWRHLLSKMSQDAPAKQTAIALENVLNKTDGLATLKQSAPPEVVLQPDAKKEDGGKSEDGKDDAYKPDAKKEGGGKSYGLALKQSAPQPHESASQLDSKKEGGGKSEDKPDAKKEDRKGDLYKPTKKEDDKGDAYNPYDNQDATKSSDSKNDFNKPDGTINKSDAADANKSGEDKAVDKSDDKNIVTFPTVLISDVIKKTYKNEEPRPDAKKSSRPVRHRQPQSVETLLERERVLERELLKLRYRPQKAPQNGWNCLCGRSNPPANNFCGTCGRRRNTVY
jgi:hypothetical protein